VNDIFLWLLLYNYSIFFHWWFFAGLHLLPLVDLVMPFIGCWLATLLDDMLHPDSCDEPVRLTLIVVSHMVLAEEPESKHRIWENTSAHGPTIIPSVSPISSNWSGSARGIQFGCISSLLRLNHSSGTSKPERTISTKTMMALQLGSSYGPHSLG
jgi:hypothetical protein